MSRHTSSRTDRSCLTPSCPTPVGFTPAKPFRRRLFDSGRVLLDVARHDSVNQTIRASHVLLSEDGVQLFPVVVRYAWPAELDAMALVAGLSLANRYADYTRRPFNAFSPRHVSIYTPGTALES